MDLSIDDDTQAVLNRYGLSIKFTGDGIVVRRGLEVLGSVDPLGEGMRQRSRGGFACWASGPWRFITRDQGSYGVLDELAEALEALVDAADGVEDEFNFVADDQEDHDADL